MFLNDSYFFTLPVSLPRYHFSLMNEQSMDGGGQINQSDIYYFNSSKHSLFFSFMSDHLNHHWQF